MKKLLMVLALLSLGSGSAAKVTFKVIGLPANTPPNSTLIIGANFNNWNPMDDKSVMNRNADGTYTLVRQFKDDDQLEFKITRGGGWATVEKNPDGSEMSNRKHTVNGDAVIEIKVARWADLGDPAAGGTAAAKPTNSVTGNVQKISVKLPKLNVSRDALVWLPADYDKDTTVRYPVVYMLDGQNVFDSATSYIGQEWKADETATELAAKGQPMIIVALNNGEAARNAEYTVRADAKEGGGKGADTLSDLVTTLKPQIDQQFRTLPDAKHTALVGSSLGGLEALYGGLNYPQTFGFIGSLSPSVWWADRAVVQDAAALKADTAPYFYLTTGDKEGNASEAAAQVKNTQDLNAALQTAGAKTSLVVVPNAVHNEDAWAAVLGELLSTFWTLAQK